MSQFTDLVQSELSELQSRDVDNLFEMIRDNCIDGGIVFNEALDGELYSEIQEQLKALKPVMYSDLCNQFLAANEVNCCTTIDSDDKGSFARRGCDCCNTGLGTTVYACNGFNPKTKQAVELGDICSNCLCYFANGDDSEVQS